jgi:arylsulfatase A-like enzyme
LIISLDCVRPEALGCYPSRFSSQVGGPRKARTPNLDRLAADGCRFDQAITHAPYTPAAHASLFTGLYPPRHGIRALRSYKLATEVTTLAETAHANGYQTAAFIGADALSRSYALQRGFDLYDDVYDRKVACGRLGYRRFGDEVTAKTVDWLERNQTGHPFFLFVHYFDAHDVSMDVAMARDRSLAGVFLAYLYRNRPRFVPTQYRKLVDRLCQRYFRRRRAGLAYHLKKVCEIDHYVGKLLAYLRANDLYDDALIVLTADHGDAFGEHGEIGHRYFLYDTTLRVPLIVKAGPQSVRCIVSGLVRLVDVVPTVHELAGLNYALPPDLDGVSLVPLMRGGVSDRSAYSETRYVRIDGNVQTLTHHFNSLRTNKRKLIWDRLTDGLQLFDVEGDRDELVDVSSQHPDLVAAMREELVRILSRSVSAERMDSTVMTDSELAEIDERLRALGYL